MRTTRLPAIVIGAILALAGCGGSTAKAAPTAASQAPTTKIKANTATETELRTIPGVGEKIADEIMEYRPYDASTGPAKFRKELAKYIPESDIEKIMAFLDFS
jgi:DNA uptake protein ComE-like DNA-binding protein